MIRTLTISILIFISQTTLFAQNNEKLLNIHKLSKYFMCCYRIEYYYKKNKLDSALLYFNKIKNTPYISGEYFMFGALISYKKENLHKANQYLKSAIKFNIKYSIPKRLEVLKKNYPKFNDKLIAQITQNSNRAYPKDSMLIKQLHKRKVKDQLYRNTNPTDTMYIYNMHTIDSLNQIWLDSLITYKGWPLKTEVGSQGAIDAWIIAQHSSEKLPFMRKCLLVMLTAYKYREVNKRDLAYLIDRYFLLTIKKQLFGSQIRMNFKTKTPIAKLAAPLFDEKNVDKLRSIMNMSSLEVYFEYINEKYAQPLH